MPFNTPTLRKIIADGEKDIEIELRIYQNDSVEIHIPELHSIVYIMDKIKNFDMRIDLLKHEVES